ncbi:MAG: flagellar protein FlaG [Oscillospiraceae bacterium]|nr:flagellar protein FlaG [Oscillospiraceae bacterium]
MKIDGMDAAVKTVTVPATNPEPLQAGHAQPGPPQSGQPSGAKTKASSGKDQAGAAGGAIIKLRIAKDVQAEKQPLKQEDEISEQIVREAIERANRMFFGNDRKFERSVHEKTRDIMVKVVDTRTNEVIREIPPQKIVDLVVSLCEIAGILFDEKG